MRFVLSERNQNRGECRRLQLRSTQRADDTETDRLSLGPQETGSQGLTTQPPEPDPAREFWEGFYPVQSGLPGCLSSSASGPARKVDRGVPEGSEIEPGLFWWPPE